MTPKFGCTFLVVLGLIPSPVAAQKAAFDAVHVEKEHSILLAGSPEQVFPLFEPEGRRL
jgi:hypothetical protein